MKQVNWIDTLQAKPIEPVQPEKEKKLMEFINIEGPKMDKLKSLTFKSVVIIVVVAVLRAVLGIWFEEATVNNVISVVNKILEAVGIAAAGTAAWGIRRKLNE